MSYAQIRLTKRPEVGSKIDGWTVTEVREDGAVFGVQGELSAETLNQIKEHFALPPHKRPIFFFRPGSRFANFKQY